MSTGFQATAVVITVTVTITTTITASLHVRLGRRMERAFTDVTAQLATPK